MKAILDILHKWCNWNSAAYRFFNFETPYSAKVHLYFVGGTIKYCVLSRQPASGRVIVKKSILSERYQLSGSDIQEVVVPRPINPRASNSVVYIECIGVKYLRIVNSEQDNTLIDER